MKSAGSGTHGDPGYRQPVKTTAEQRSYRICQHRAKNKNIGVDTVRDTLDQLEALGVLVVWKILLCLISEDILSPYQVTCLYPPTPPPFRARDITHNFVGSLDINTSLRDHLRQMSDSRERLGTKKERRIDPAGCLLCLVLFHLCSVRHGDAPTCITLVLGESRAINFFVVI